MTCEEIRNELVAYRDGELAENDHARVAAHLRTCVACTQEEAELARVDALFTSLERVTLSPAFADTFWQRLAQEERHVHVSQESRWRRWWQEWKTALTGWQLAPALAGAASILLFFGYITSSKETSPPAARQSPSPATVAQRELKQAGAPAGRVQPVQGSPELTEKVDLFLDYRVIAELEKFSNFEQIAAVRLEPEADAALAEAEVPPDVRENFEFFTQFPILEKLDGLQNFDAVLDASVGDEEQSRG